jgi:chemotaxis protein methyltransferase CheR
MLEFTNDLRMDSDSFQAIADLAYDESGLTLIPAKAMMIQSRLRHRLRELGMSKFVDYCHFIQSKEGLAERQHLISALTTNVSHFFRENHHFDQLRIAAKRHLPNLYAGGKLRIWSAGCSNGQEAVSAAITLLEEIPNASSLDIKILATDIDREVVRFARVGQYPKKFLEGVPFHLRTAYFNEIPFSGDDNIYQMSSQVLQMIRFNELNLLADWPMLGPIDVIFCRNVVIYFDKKTQRNLWPKFRDILSEGGVLFLGHSERIPEPEKFGFSDIGPTTYRKL